MSRGWLYLRTGLNHLTPLRLPHLNLRNVLILALLVRLLFLFAVVLPFFEEGVLNKADTREFDQEAQAIAFQGQNSLDYPEWGILYYMAGIYRLFGPSSLAVGLAQIGVAVLACLSIYLIGKLVSGPQVGLWAALGDSLKRLSLFAAELRYPGEAASKQDAMQAVKAMRQWCSRLRQPLGISEDVE